MLSTWHQRYWLGGLTLAILLIVSVVMNPLLPTNKQVDRRGMGLDFVAFYTAGTFIREGRAGELYNLSAVEVFEKNLASKNDLDLQKVAAWWNPPIFAFALEPLSALSFRAAYWAWLGINVACLSLAIVLLLKWLPAETQWKYRALLPLLVGVSMPTIQAIGHAQNSAISLLILVVALSLAKQKKAILAGAVVGLLLYKPQIALAVALILAVCFDWRICFGFAVAALTVVAANLILLPDTLGTYITQLGTNLHAIQFGQTYIWERQVTLSGFWRLLIQGREAGERSSAVTVLALISQATMAMWLCFAWSRSRPGSLAPSPGTPGEGRGEGTSSISNLKFQMKNALTLTLSGSSRLTTGRSTGRGDRNNEWLLVVALPAMPLLLPYFLDYDLLLLAAPATLFAARYMKNPPVLSTALWTALYLVLWINPGLGRITHVNLAVPLLCATTAAMMIGERSREALAAGPADKNHEYFVPLAA